MATSFIEEIIEEHLRTGEHGGRVVTRFPPEPNGYLHIGHAKSITLNFGLAQKYGGVCHLRFDDSNPETEDIEYVESIQRDVRWLGFDWDDKLFFASDYFEQLYEWAERLVIDGKAYVCSLSDDKVREYRGTLTEPGRPSPDRDRPPEESLDLLRRMRAGEFEEGRYTLRAKIDLAAANMKMRDPLIYRIRHATHYRTSDDWCIYPFYDFTHCLSDAIEHITHSVCTLEFENNRELYDWFIDNLPVPARPRQYEFARLFLSSTVMSKRMLLQLVKNGHVTGWDDPRMPTIAGLRRRGVTPEAIRAFCDRIGVAKNNSVVDLALFEHHVRDDLNRTAPRVLAVLRPLEVLIENYPKGLVEHLDAPSFPSDIGLEGSRPVPFSRTLYIDRTDFSDEPPRGWKRLSPGREVRLRHAYVIRCEQVVRDKRGKVVKLVCTYDPESRGGKASDGRKVDGTIHWVSAPHALRAEVRLYDRLFAAEKPGEATGDFLDDLTPDSLIRLTEARVEPSLGGCGAGARFQFERHGYFCSDPDTTSDLLVFNLTVGLRDTWSKEQGSKEQGSKEQGSKEQGSKEQGSKEKASKGQERRAGASEQPASGREEPARVAPQESAPAAPPKTDTTPETPEATRFRARYALPSDLAVALTSEPGLAQLFEDAVAAGGDPTASANWIKTEILRELKERCIEDLPFGGAQLAELVLLVGDGTITATAGKEVFAQLVREGGSPRRIVADRGLRQVADEDVLLRTVRDVLSSAGAEVERYRAGETRLLSWFVGQVMRATRGKANPQMTAALLERELG